jgi:hypothetical protein
LMPCVFMIGLSARLKKSGLGRISECDAPLGEDNAYNP